MLQNRTARNAALGGGGFLLLAAVAAIAVMATLAVAKGGDTAVPSISLPSGSSAGSTQQQAREAAPPAVAPPAPAPQPDVAHEQPTATFRGRLQPSASFPLSDIQYIEAGKEAIGKPGFSGSLWRPGQSSPFKKAVAIGIYEVITTMPSPSGDGQVTFSSLFADYEVTLPDGKVTLVKVSFNRNDEKPKPAWVQVIQTLP